MIAPRTVVVTVEIQRVTESITAIRDEVKEAIQRTLIGHVRQVRVEVIQGTRRKKKAKGRG